MHVWTIQEIPIRVHGSFLLLGSLLLGYEFMLGGVPAAMGALLGGLVIFGSVLLHELGHALTGRAFGIRTRDITLYPFGGIASMEARQLAPLAELLISAAGPAVNFALALGFALLDRFGLPVAAELAWMNLALGAFNLVPAWPMDGGRVLRALLVKDGNQVEATLKVLRISRVFAWLFIATAPLVGSWSLALIGVFLLVVGRSERRRWLAVSAAYAQQAGPPPGRPHEPGPALLAQLPFGHPVR